VEAVVGIDIGGSGTKGALVDLAAGRFAAPRVRLATPSPATPDRVADVVVELLAQLDAPGPVGLALPAVVRGGIVETAANIDEAWIGTDALELFGRAVGRPVAVINDADAAGLAEVRFGAGRGRSGVTVVITLGTGIGSAVFVDGTLVPNTELGHLPLHHGDAEDWAADSIREKEDLSWTQWAHRLEHYLELVERVLSPQLIIIGGGVSKKSDKFLPRIDIRTELVPAELYNDAGIVGAALVATGQGPPAHPAPAPPTDQPPPTRRRR
jgi:polyphosphate glucokinase